MHWRNFSSVISQSFNNNPLPMERCSKQYIPSFDIYDIHNVKISINSWMKCKYYPIFELYTTSIMRQGIYIELKIVLHREWNNQVHWIETIMNKNIFKVTWLLLMNCNRKCKWICWTEHTIVDINWNSVDFVLCV